MFKYEGHSIPVSHVALMVLTDEESGWVDGDELDIVTERLLKHMSGAQPIDGKRWLRRELRREKKLKQNSR